jgi:exosortase/archaeosortase family protein
LIGIPCVQNGTALLSAPNAITNLPLGARFQIDIADPCSGLHSLLPLLMFSSFYSYFFLRRRWHQWTVFLSAIPFAIVGNTARILMLVIASLMWGSDFAIGTNSTPSRFHEACGYAVFVIVLGMECLLGFLLDRAERRRFRQASQTPLIEAAPGKNVVPPAAAGDDPPLGEVPAWRSGIMIGFAAIMAMICWLTPPVYLPSHAGVVMNLPDQVTLPNLTGGHFYGVDAPISEIEHRLLPKDTEFTRKNYDDLHDHQVFFSIVLNGVQQYTIHAPEVCLVAQGWTIIGQEDVPIELNSGHKLIVRNLSLQREAINTQQQHLVVKAYYMYWYVADDITTPSHLARNWMSSWDRVVHNRDHRWAYVIAMSLITQTVRPDGLDADQTRDMLMNFIRQIVPTFQKNEIPGYAANS